MCRAPYLLAAPWPACCPAWPPACLLPILASPQLDFASASPLPSSAPRHGPSRLQVKPDDNVEVGHLVATIAEGATAAAPAPEQQQQAAAAAEQPSPPPPQPKPAAAEPTAAAPTKAAAHRTPSISFPPRRAPTGEVISSMAPAAAQQLLASMLGGGGGGGAAEEEAAPAAKPAPIPAEYRHMIAVPIVGGSQPILRGMPVPPGPPGPPRRTMTDAEVEAIMLGGADP